MLHLNTATEHPNNDSGHSKVQRDISLVTSVLATVEQNPFLHQSPQLINIMNGQLASNEVKYDLTHIKEIGLRELAKTLGKDHSKKVRQGASQQNLKHHKKL